MATKRTRKSKSAPEVSNYEIVNHWFDLAADRLELRDDIRAVLRSAYREVQVQIPVKLGDGKIHVFSGYRVQHNGARGPVQGRHPLPPRGRPRRGARARLADDLEDGDRRRSRSAARRAASTATGDAARARRAAADHALVHRQDREGARARRATSRRPTSTPTPR